MASNRSKSVERPKALVAHRHTLVRQGLASLLAELGFDPVAEANSPPSLLGTVRRSKPEIVVMEWELGPEAEETIGKLASLEPRPVVVILVPPEMQTEVQPVLKAGANGYLSLNITAEELADTIRLLQRGGFVVSGEMAEALANQETSSEADEQATGLSGREREVLGLVASGATNREIAEALVVTENTVKVHLRNVLDKLHLRNRQQAVAFAVREGIIAKIDVSPATGGPEA